MAAIDVSGKVRHFQPLQVDLPPQDRPASLGQSVLEAAQLCYGRYTKSSLWLPQHSPVTPPDQSHREDSRHDQRGQHSPDIPYDYPRPRESERVG